MNPFNPDIPVARINAQFNLTMEIGVKEGFILTGKIIKQTLQVKEFQPLYYSDQTVNDIGERIHSIEKLVLIVINIKLAEGLKMPMPDQILKRIKSTSIQLFEGFVMIDGNK